MAITKYELYYNSILNYVKEIKEQNGYKNESVSFAHWYLKNHFNLNDQEIAESIIDGDGDLGLDAILFNEETKSLSVFQFKFPSKKSTITDEIKQGDILKTLHGFDTLIRNDIPYNGKNVKFRNFKQSINSFFISEYKIFFVSFNKGIVAEDNTDILKNVKKKFFLGVWYKFGHNISQQRYYFKHL